MGVGWTAIIHAALLGATLPLPTAVLVSVASKLWLAISPAIWLLISLPL